MWEQLLINVPVGIALIITVEKFLTHIAKERALDREMWGNHLKQSIAVQQETVKILSELREYARRRRF